MLFFADDVVIMAKTVEGIQTIFGAIKEYCTEHKLGINLGKGKTEITRVLRDRKGSQT